MSKKFFSLFLTATIALSACGTFEVSIIQKIQTPTALAVDPTKITLEIEATPSQATHEPILTPQSSTKPTVVAPPYGASIALEKVVDLEDGYILIGSLHWTDPRLVENYGMMLNEYVSLADVNGNAVAFEGVDDPNYLFTAPDSQSVPLLFKVVGKNHAWPITLSIKPTVILPVDVSFPIDPGPNPQPGQSWDVNLDVPVGEHNTIHVVSASLAKHEAYYQLAFVMRSDTILGASVHDKEHSSFGGAGSGAGGNPREFETYLSYNGILPGGPLAITITSIHILLDLPLQVTWQP